MAVSNPRFPHHCRIYRMEGEDSWSGGTEKVLYDGECRKYGNDSLRTFKTGGVMYGDYAISVPGTVEGIRSGDLIDVEDRSVSWTRVTVTDCYSGNLGTTVYFNMPHN